MSSYASSASSRDAVRGYYQQYMGRAPVDEEIDNWMGATGGDLSKIKTGLRDHPDAKDSSSVSGGLVGSGLSGLVDLGNKYKDNATIGGLVAGKIGDVFSTQANTGLALAYNDAFLGSLGSYQQSLENAKKGNAMELMAAEGRIAKDLQADELSTERYKSDRTVDQTRLTADASKYGYDRQLEGTKYQSDSEERQIGLKGNEERKNLIEQTNQQLALRRDARGAIARTGQRFYG